MTIIIIFCSKQIQCHFCFSKYVNFAVQTLSQFSAKNITALGFVGTIRQNKYSTNDLVKVERCFEEPGLGPFVQS